MRPTPDERQEMADAVAALKKALREAVAKDLRRVGFWMVRLGQRIDPPPPIRIPHWDPVDRLAVFEPRSFLPPEPPKPEPRRSWLVPGLRLPWDPPKVSEPPARVPKCGEIIYAMGGWGQKSTPGGVCRLDRGHDGDHVPS